MHPSTRQSKSTHFRTFPVMNDEDGCAMVLPLIVNSGQIGKYPFLSSIDQGPIVFPDISKKGVDFDPSMSVLARLDKRYGKLIVRSDERNLTHSRSLHG